MGEVLESSSSMQPLRLPLSVPAPSGKAGDLLAAPTPVATLGSPVYGLVWGHPAQETWRVTSLNDLRGLAYLGISQGQAVVGSRRRWGGCWGGRQSTTPVSQAQPALDLLLKPSDSLPRFCCCF